MPPQLAGALFLDPRASLDEFLPLRQVCHCIPLSLAQGLRILESAAHDTGMENEQGRPLLLVGILRKEAGNPWLSRYTERRRDSGSSARRCGSGASNEVAD